jgi:hypothetical protein
MVLCPMLGGAEAGSSVVKVVQARKEIGSRGGVFAGEGWVRSVMRLASKANICWRGRKRAATDVQESKSRSKSTCFSTAA